MKKYITIIVVSVLVVILVLIFYKKPFQVIVEAPASNQAQISPVVSAIDRNCYAYHQEATNEAPYKVDEYIDMVVNGDSVLGTKHGTQVGPDMSNGYDGTLVGDLRNNILTVIFSYVIEGSANSEKEIYSYNANGIEKLRYPLKEEKGILVPDMTQSFNTLTYTKVDCSEIIQ